MMSLACILIMAVTFVAADPSCPLPLEPVPTTVDMQDTLKPIFDNSSLYFDQYLRLTNITAGVLGIANSGGLLFSHAYGLKNKLNPTSTPDLDTIFRIGSVTKVFASIAIYQLRDRGLIGSLDDPVQKYVPDFKPIDLYPGKRRGVTFRQMLSQMSGLPREGCPLLNCNWTDAYMWDYIQKNVYLTFQPYQEPSYSNLAFGILGNVAAIVDGSPSFASYCQKYIFDVLGMQRSMFTAPPSTENNFAVGYYADGTVAPLTDIGWEGPAGQMYSTVNDLLLLLNDLMDPVQSKLFIFADTARQLALPMFLNPSGSSAFGTPWEMQQVGSYLLDEKGGNIMGYSACIVWIPRIRFAMAFLVSGQADEFAVSTGFASAILPALTSYLQLHQAPYPLPTNALDYLGTYGGLLGVQIVNNSLGWIENGRLSAVLMPFAPDVFQIGVPGYGVPIPMDCLNLELQASINAVVAFQRNSSGIVVSLTLPGNIPGQLFSKK